jgi:hypothetical protein
MIYTAAQNAIATSPPQKIGPAQPPPLQIPGPGTRQDVLAEDDNRFKELLLEHNISLNDVA